MADPSLSAATGRQSTSHRPVWLRPHFITTTALVLFFLFHLYQISAPPNGYHNWRESDTAAVILNYFQDDLPLLTPRTNELASSSEMAGIELPIYCWIAAWGYSLMGPNHIAAHLVTILAALACLWFFGRAVAMLEDEMTGAMAVWALAFSPLFFYYSYKIMPDILMLCLLIGSLYFYMRFIAGDRYGSWIASVLCLALSASIKPFGLAIYVPLVYFHWRRGSLDPRRLGLLALHALLSIVPLLIWVAYSGWLINRTGVLLSFVDYLFTPLFLKRFFLQWPFELWLGWTMVPVFGVGLFHFARKKAGGFYIVWAVAMFVVMALVARYSRIHDYYSLLLVPPLAVITGFGLKRLFEGNSWQRAMLALVILAAPVGAALRVQHRFGPTEEFHELREAAARIIHRDSKVIVEDNTRGAIRLYQLNRKGWYIEPGEIDKAVYAYARQGATYLILNRPIEEYDNRSGLRIRDSAINLGPLYCYVLDTSGNK